MKRIEEILSNIKSIGYFLASHNDIEANAKLHQEIKDSEGKDLTSDIVDLKLSDLQYNLDLLQKHFASNNVEKKLEGEKQKKAKINVAIVSIIDKEFDALNNVFNFKKTGTQIKLNTGLRVWKSELIQKANENQKLSLLFAKIGSAGNLASFAISDMLLKNFEIDLMIMCGIAAGNEDKAKIYSAIIGNKIIYYETQKLIEKKYKNPKTNKVQVDSEIRYRLEPLSISANLSHEIEEVDKDRWIQKFLEVLKKNKIKIKRSELLVKQQWIDLNWKKKLEIGKGGILAGEKLFADGKTLKNLCSKIQIGKEIFAGEMEGYGFAFACKQNDKSNWLVFRGISDFGGNEKSTPVNESYQIIAAYSAATLVYDYLENIYSPTSVAL